MFLDFVKKGLIYMIHDLEFGKLDNQFRQEAPDNEDFIICVQANKLLAACNKSDILTVPTWQQIQEWSVSWDRWYDDMPVQYAFTLQDKKYFIWMGTAGEPKDENFKYEGPRFYRQLASKATCFALMTGLHIFTWYRANRFCGCCGHPTVHDAKERMMKCPECGNMIFPRIAPAVIIALTNGDNIMLAQHAALKQKRYGLLAGFIEIGETAEEAVAREIMQEVGLKVKNIRYYKTQPWGIVGNLSLGYYCELDGDDNVTLDENELSAAEWHHRDNLPVEAADDGISLTREMIRVFGEGKEPK